MVLAVGRCVLVVTVVLSSSCPKDPPGSFVTVDIDGTIEAPAAVCPLPVFPLMMSQQNIANGTGAPSTAVGWMEAHFKVSQ